MSKIYECLVNNKTWTIECDNIDQAIALSLLYTQKPYMIAVYNKEDEKATLKFPYQMKRLTRFLAQMDSNERLRMYATINPDN